MAFKLPETLPGTVDELNALKSEATAEIETIQARYDDGETLTKDEVEALRGLIEAVGTIDAEITETEATAAEAKDLFAQAAASKAKDAEKAEATAEVEDTEEADKADDGTDEVEVDETAAAEVVAEAERAAEDASKEAVVAAGKQVEFAGKGAVIEGEIVEDEAAPGWEMDTNAPGYQRGKVGFAALAKAIDSVRGGSRRMSPTGSKNGFSTQVIARLSRGVEEISDSHALVAAIEKATTVLPNGQAVNAVSLTAAGGWCAPSEQLYTFCDVPDAVDLVSLPEITITRGGVRWPVEPDLSEIFESFQFFFTEPELEAEDAEGNPTAVKHCVEIPCPDEFEELRLNAVGYCVNAGILQAQGWPELIEWFMRSLAAEHLRAISRRTILDMVAGSGPAKVIPAASQIAAASSVLNSLALQATNLRLNKGLARTATIEGVAPSWFFEVLRADLANQEGTDSKAVTDAQITTWLTARNIALQFVGDWQTRETGQPGHLDTVEWPDTVDVLLYPAGTWFRAMSNVIELGVMYPKEQLQVNRYTQFFTEDAIAVGKRCNRSILVRVPICPSGAVGARQTINCNTPAVTP